MRGFANTLSEEIAFTRGHETVTYRLTPTPILYAARVQMAYPEPADDAPGARLYWSRLSFILLAASLPDEDLPAPPWESSDRAVWDDHADGLVQMFAAAGLTEQQVRQMNKVVTTLSERAEAADEALGNSSAPAGAPSAA